MEYLVFKSERGVLCKSTFTTGTTRMKNWNMHDFKLTVGGSFLRDLGGVLDRITATSQSKAADDHRQR